MDKKCYYTDQHISRDESEVIRKRVTLHPLKPDGSMDTEVNLYPKVFLDGIVDRNGNPVDIQTLLVPGDNITIENGIISATGNVTQEQLEEAIADKAKCGQLNLNDYLTEQEIMNLGVFLIGWDRTAELET